MGGGDIRTPAPVDYSAVMLMTSQNQANVQMAQIGAGIIGMELASQARQDKIQSDLTLGLETLDNKKEIAQMNFNYMRLAEYNRHDEAMEQLDVRRFEIQQGPTVDISGLGLA